MRRIACDVKFDILALFEVFVWIGTQQVGHTLPFSLLGYERVISEELSCTVEVSELIETNLHPDSFLDIL